MNKKVIILKHKNNCEIKEVAFLSVQRGQANECIKRLDAEREREDLCDLKP